MAVANAIVAAATGVVDAARDPKIRAAAARYAEKALANVKGMVGTDGSLDLKAIAQRGPAPAGVVLSAFASAGVNPDTMFTNLIDAQRDRNMAALLEQLRAIFNSRQQAMDATSLINNAGGDVADDLYQKRVIMFAKEKFGPPNRIREAHALFRAFLAMDSATIDRNIALHLA